MAGDLLTDAIHEFLTDHLEEAINHTREAVRRGNAGELDAFVTQARFALAHAEAIVEKLDYSAKIKDAIPHLKMAIREGNKRYRQAAVKHAAAALSRLEQATQ